MGNITIYKVNGEETLYAENSDEGIDILTPGASQYDLAIAILARVFEKTTVSIRILEIEANDYSLSMEQKISWKTVLMALRECHDILDRVEYLRFATSHLVQYEIAKQVLNFQNEEYHVMTYGEF
ncbi:unnamed protein product [Caenorhabditis brenneri]